MLASIVTALLITLPSSSAYQTLLPNSTILVVPANTSIVGDAASTFGLLFPPPSLRGGIGQHSAPLLVTAMFSVTLPNGTQTPAVAQGSYCDDGSDRLNATTLATTGNIGSAIFQPYDNSQVGQYTVNVNVNFVTAIEAEAANCTSLVQPRFPKIAQSIFLQAQWTLLPSGPFSIPSQGTEAKTTTTVSYPRPTGSYGLADGVVPSSAGSRNTHTERSLVFSVMLVALGFVL